MYKLCIAGAAAATVFGAAGAASAEDVHTTWYGGLGYTDTRLHGADMGAVQGRIGARFGQHFGAEGETAFGVGRDDIGGGDRAKVKDAEAIYGVAFLPVQPNLDLFARVGYGRTRIDVDGPDRFRSSDSGLRYGAGAQWFWDGSNGLRGEYTHENRSGADAHVWGASFVHKF